MSTYALRKALGDWGEELAAAHLRDAGMQILERNYRSGRLGELDIVAVDDGVVVAVEVKTRRDTRYGTPAEAVTDDKAARLRRLAGQWMQERRVSARGLRIDVVTVLVRRPSPTIDHRRGVA